MGAVSRQTGLSPHVLRAWERRYGAVTPERTAGGTRHYSPGDVERLELLASLVSAGFKISDIAKLDRVSLMDLRARDSGGPGAGDESPHDLCQRYLAAVSRCDAGAAAEVLGRAAERLDPIRLALDVMLPAVRHFGSTWRTDRMDIAREHLATGQITGLLAGLIRTAHGRTGPKVVIAAPARHRHDVGLLVGALMAARRGFDPIHLGVDMPRDAIELARQASGARLIVLGIARQTTGRQTAPLARDVASLAERSDVWLCAPASHPVIDATQKLDRSVRAFSDYRTFDEALIAQVELEAKLDHV
jgi:DNA-binding transcriptional MerR regulator/methylmalonyl-CoA mutase cobalamin-binding subunit